MDVTFSVARLLAICPALSQAYETGALTEDAAALAWDVACSSLGGAGDGSPYPYNPGVSVRVREFVLYAATGHLLLLDLTPGGAQGRITSASQGSVSTSFDLVKANKALADWWLQTPCGARFWMLTGAYRAGGRVYVRKDFHPWG